VSESVKARGAEAAGQPAGTLRILQHFVDSLVVFDTRLIDFGAVPLARRHFPRLSLASCTPSTK